MITGNLVNKRGDSVGTWEINDADETRLREMKFEMIMLIRSRTGLGMMDSKKIADSIGGRRP